MSRDETVALVGLGNMGIEIAGCLVRAGRQVVAVDRSPRRRELAEQLHDVPTVESIEALPDTGTLLLSLPSPAVSRTVIAEYGERGNTTGVMVVETSTVLPTDMELAAIVAGGSGMSVVDAAVMAGVQQMANGTAILLCGGNDVVLDSLTPTFAAFSKAQVRFGGVGSGMAAKVVNNAVAHALMTVFVEAGSLATAAGVSIDRLLDLLTDPVMGIQRPLTHRYAERVRCGDYEGGMPVSAALKDSTLALELAQRNRVPIFAIQACQTVYDLAVAEGHGALDYSAIAKLWERWGVPASD